MRKTIALIPAYGPAASLIPLVKQLKAYEIDSLVINDGSPEDYAPVFNGLPEDTVVIRHEENMGKGAALKTGLLYIEERTRDCIVVTADADGQHLPEDILRCAKEADRYPDSLVLGVRTFSKEGVPFRSALGNRLTSVLFRLFAGRSLCDTQTGLRAFHRNMIPMFLETEGTKYEYEMNQLLQAAARKIPFREVKIETIYQNGNRTSHYRPFRDSVLILKQFLLFALSGISGFLLDYGLFVLFSGFFPSAQGILISNVLARVFSAAFNYEMNRTMVFRSTKSRKESFGGYVILACLVLVLNTSVLYFLTSFAGLSRYPAKVITEILLSLFSWTMQKNVVFAQERKGESAL